MAPICVKIGAVRERYLEDLEKKWKVVCCISCDMHIDRGTAELVNKLRSGKCHLHRLAAHSSPKLHVWNRGQRVFSFSDSQVVLSYPPERRRIDIER